MDLANINKVYFVGIGGIGMSALARYFAKKGCRVFGYDKTKTPLTMRLAQEGIAVSYEDKVAEIPDLFAKPAKDILVVNTPAIPKDSQILNFFKKAGFALKKRSEVLGMISEKMFCIAVAGTHGKTTTSTIIAHLLKATGFDCTAFLGGISRNYNSNMLYGQNNVAVVEADEYDRSFLTLRPDVAVITSIEADHLDIYGSENRLKESFGIFASQLKKDGRLFIKEGLNLPGITYGVETASAIKAKNVRLREGSFLFDFEDGYASLKDIRLPMPGRHNLENATVAIGVALSLGIHPQSIKKAIAEFKGVKRRFEIIVNNKKHIYIDDYAHHPQELKACFNAVREFYPGKRLTVVFQPHLFTRTQDFADEFAAVLSAVDEIILLEIYPARELPIEGVNAQMLLNKINCSHKRLCTKQQALEWAKTEKPELILTVGAGDIDTLVQPLKTILEK